MQTQTQPVMATHKIIILIAFICTALMSSLFIYHARQKPLAPVLSADVGNIFPVPRNIKGFKLASSNGAAFTEKDLYHHWTLMFFGFTHCASICPATLDVMQRAYPELHAQFPDLQVVLVSVDPERDTPENLQKYTESYHADFIGVTGKIQEIRKLQSQLGVYSARESSASDNYQIQHTSSIMLINPEGKWAGLLRFGLTPSILASAVKTAISTTEPARSKKYGDA